MREIVLDPSFVQKVEELNAKRDIPSIVLYLAKALDELPADMAEDVLYHSLVTFSLGGKQLDQEELVLSLLELFRIRAEKDDGFMALPTAKWHYLEGKSEYQTMAGLVKCPLDLGMILHTISEYLKKHQIEEIDEMVRGLEMFKDEGEEIVKHNKEMCMYSSQIISICSCYVGRDEYIECLADSFENVGEFEIAFADLFIMMANEPLVYA